MNAIQKQSVLRRLEGPANLEPKRGRPAKKESIKSAYRALYPEGHKGRRLEEVRRQVEAYSDQEISKKTLSRAISEIKSETDKKPKI